MKKQKELQAQLKRLAAKVEDLEAFAGVMVPLFEKEYKKAGYDFSKK